MGAMAQPWGSLCGRVAAQPKRCLRQMQRGGAGAAAATASGGRNREPPLAQRSNFHKGAPAARRENWLSARGTRSAFCKRATSRAAKAGHRNPDWVKILPQRERQSCRYPIRRGASRFGRSCPRAAGPAGRSPISRREQNKKSLLQNGSRDLVKLWTHRAAGREPHKENRTLPPAGRSLSRSRGPVQSKSPRSQKQEQGLGFLDWARRSLHGYSGAAQTWTKRKDLAAR